MRIDLHLHSSASDGACDPAALVNAACAGGLNLISLTDHDTVDGLAAAAEAARDAGVQIIPGVEISTTHAGAELHMLGYYVDPASRVLREHGTAAAERRRERILAMIQLLQERGLRIDLEDVLAVAGAASALGRPHLARALVERGHVPNVAQAFNRFLADGRPAYLPTELLTPRAAIDLIRHSGGLAVWAHPPLTTFQTEGRRFVEWGLQGFECFRPNTPPNERRLLRQTTEELGVIPTGGSDWHGPWHGRLGTFFLQQHDIPGFLAERRGDAE